jgi:hypothetical protein
VYGWIWRRFPFGVPGRIAGMLMLATAVAGLLWFYVFPAVDPLLPFNDVRVTAPGGPAPTPPPTPAPTGLPR